MPISDPRDRFFYPILTFMMDSYIPKLDCSNKHAQLFSGTLCLHFGLSLHLPYFVYVNSEDAQACLSLGCSLIY